MTAYLFAKRHRASLASFAHSDVMVVFDYDGTLAPIAERPGAARMRAVTLKLLADASRLYPCVVISGRADDDIAARLAAVPVWSVTGNHGVEPWGRNLRYAARVRGWVKHLESRLSGVAGVMVEDKRYTVAVHYRRSPNRRRARQAIEAALDGLRGARVIGGKMTVNLLPKGAPHKGIALERARRLFACDTAIYVGDDETDEDAFGAASRQRLLAIRIGQSRQTRAAYHLRNQREIDRLLRVLVALRTRQTVDAHGATSAAASGIVRTPRPWHNGSPALRQPRRATKRSAS